MASNAASAILNVPGVVSFDGVTLGPTKDNSFHPNVQTVDLFAEEMGTVVERFNVGSMPVFACVIRSFNSTVVSQIFPALSPNVISGTAAPGKSLASKTGVLRFTPDSSSHPGLVLYAASPMPEDSSIIRFSWDSNLEFGITALFYGLPDSSGNVWDWV